MGKLLEISTLSTSPMIILVSSGTLTPAKAQWYALSDP